MIRLVALTLVALITLAATARDGGAAEETAASGPSNLLRLHADGIEAAFQRDFERSKELQRRSAAVRAEFKRLHPCPATGQARGACPGWEVDHVQALVCGGRDEPANLQWLTAQEHREKTRRDMRGCRARDR